MKKLLYILLLGLMCGALSSCVKTGADDDCQERVRLNFSVEVQGRSSSTVDRSAVKRVDLFIFDKDGYFLERRVERFETLPDNFHFDLMLDPQLYTFVAWTNLENDYSISPSEFLKGSTKISQAKILINHTSGVVTSLADPLAFGEIKNAEIKQGVTDQTLTLYLQNNTYKINVRTEGLHISSDFYSIKLRSQGGMLNFENSVLRSSELQYTQLCSKDTNGQLSASLQALRLYESPTSPRAPIYVSITNDTSGQTLFPHEGETGNLVELITRLREVGIVVDFDQIHQYDILLKFDANMNLTIWINGWNIPINIDKPLEP